MNDEKMANILLNVWKEVVVVVAVTTTTVKMNRKIKDPVGTDVEL